MLPDLVPIDDAASWLTARLRYQVSTDFFLQLKESGAIEIVEVEMRIKAPSPPVSQTNAVLKPTNLLRSLFQYRTVACIKAEDLEALASSTRRNTLTEKSWASIVAVLRSLLLEEYPKDTALIARICDGYPTLRGAGERNLQKALAIARDQLKV
ncbi:hypothetical protein R0137_11090 [Congregibacter brevis]|uniref:Uncharacterized protein n=1 Tax=Congregibacter brevis TaxID=3081201 RepID=A0ABZ0I8D4_9GAMM|nr:hypothetical protein R0137_11090 [Congregibacter sp. IMCC45268]